MEPRNTLLAFVLALETSLLIQPLAGARAQVDESTAPPRATLHWVREAGAQDCIDGRELARRVESKLRRPVFDAPRDAELLVEGTAQRKGEGYRAALHTYDREGKPLGSREVLSERASCDELSEAVAVVLAVMIDPAGALHPPAPVPPAPEAPSEPAREPPAPEETHTEQASPPCPEQPPPPAAPGAPSPRAEVSAFARATHGHVPAFVWGGGVAFELELTRWGGVRLEGVMFAERAVDGPMGTGVDVRVFYGSALYCPLWWSAGRLRASACMGLAAGALQSRAFGFDRGRDSASPLFDGVLDVHGALRLWRGLGLYAGGGLSTPFARTRFAGTLPDGSPMALFEQPALSGRFDLGLGTRF